jgi:hypothetical protein
MSLEEQRKAIIEDASRREFEAWLKDTGRGWSEIAFAAWQIARNQSNNVPVAWMNEKLCIIKSSTKALNEVELSDYNIPLYTSPQQINALEMAAKLVETRIQELTSFLNDAAGEYKRGLTDSIDELECIKTAIRALIPHPESTAPKQAIPSGWKLVPIEPTEDMEAYGNSKADEIAVSVNGTRFKLDMCTAYEVYKAMLNVAPQPESEGK